MDRMTMEQRSDSNYSINKMPYKGKPGDKNPIIDMKRKELAKKKADIIYGQNTQTKAAYAKTPKRVGNIGL